MNDETSEALAAYQIATYPIGDPAAAIALPNVSDGAAFGAPGIAPTWSSSDKDFVTTALGDMASSTRSTGHPLVSRRFATSASTWSAVIAGSISSAPGATVSQPLERTYRRSQFCTTAMTISSRSKYCRIRCATYCWCASTLPVRIGWS